MNKKASNSIIFIVVIIIIVVILMWFAGLLNEDKFGKSPKTVCIEWDVNETKCLDDSVDKVKDKGGKFIDWFKWNRGAEYE